MIALVKVQPKGQVTIPLRLRNQAGIADGDIVEARFRRGRIELVPMVLVQKSAFPNADDEYTSAQRKAVNSRLAKSADELRKGRGAGPFHTADEMIAHMKTQLRKRKASRKSGVADENRLPSTRS